MSFVFFLTCVHLAPGDLESFQGNTREAKPCTELVNVDYRHKVIQLHYVFECMTLCVRKPELFMFHHDSEKQEILTGQLWVSIYLSLFYIYHISSFVPNVHVLFVDSDIDFLSVQCKNKKPL